MSKWLAAVVGIALVLTAVGIIAGVFESDDNEEEEEEGLLELWYESPMFELTDDQPASEIDFENPASVIVTGSANI